MKKLTVSKSKDENNTFSLTIKGQDFTFVLFTKNEEECDFRKELAKDIIDYYEIAKKWRPLELTERLTTPQFIFYSILSGRNEYSIKLSKITKEFSCTCEHGSLHSVNNEESCKHIKLCQKIEEKYTIHEEK